MQHPQLKIAVLHQAVEPPVVNDVRKPRKPGGYKDSGADIAFVLKTQCRIPTITPDTNPDAQSDDGWTFPDTEVGILEAINAGATCLWANTILFAEHPLQTSPELDRYCENLKVVGQPPPLVDAYDDKAFVNGMIRRHTSLPVPHFAILHESTSNNAAEVLSHENLRRPLVVKPIRGRGSHGVKVCRSRTDLNSHIAALFAESPSVMVEEFLSGEEGTVTVMPPSKDRDEYWAMPLVLRYNHADDIAPYSGAVAVTQNSRVLTDEESRHDPVVTKVAEDCATVARFLQVKAPIRIDVRKPDRSIGTRFFLFDINMKPNMTVPGRPGREDQASLTAMAATGLGWDAPTLLSRILDTARPLKELRSTRLPFAA